MTKDDKSIAYGQNVAFKETILKPAEKELNASNPAEKKAMAELDWAEWKGEKQPSGAQIADVLSANKNTPV